MSVMELDQVAGGSLVCCLLCRGMIKDGFKDGNIDRFRAHMYNEHAVIYDIEYMLASSLMDRAMVEEVASSIRQTQAAAMLEERENNMKIEEETLKESSSVGEENIKKELTVENSRTVEETRTSEETKLIEEQKAVDETNQCPTCYTHFVAKTMFLQHLRKGCKKEVANKTLECKDCPKTFNSKPGLKMHVEKKHGIANEESVENIKKEVETSDLNVSMDESMYESADDSFNTSDTIGEDKLGVDRSVVEDENGTSKVALKTHVCSLCGKAQSSKASFKGHLGRKHPEQLISNEYLESCKVTDQGTVVSKPKAFPCDVCSKGYSNKVSLRQHQIKDHGSVTMKGTRGRPPLQPLDNFGQEEKNISDNPGVDSMEDFESKEKEARLRAEELERIKAEYYGVINEGGTEASTSNLNTLEPSGGDSSSTLTNSLSTITDPSALPTDPKPSFLTDNNIDFEAMDESSNENLRDSTLDTSNSAADDVIGSAIDTSQSRYFQKNPNVFANARGKSLKLFAEEAVGLPAGWKMRSIEREGKEGAKVTSIKHYLTPDQKVLKTGLAVIEYLRLEGKLSPDQLLEVRTTLKISDKKLKDLYE